MAVEPDEEAIQTFIEFAAGASRDTAIAFLKAFGPEPDKAVNSYFEKEPLPSANAENYDETAFNQDRYGNFNNANVPAFQIDTVDNLGSFGQSGAPTRPPSRTSHAGSSTYLKDNWTSDNYLSPTAGGWNNSAVELIPDVLPLERKGPGLTRFLKPLASGDSLPNLMTILATIPLARKALLSLPHAFPDYGYHQDWWNGSGTISQAIVTDAETGNAEAESLRYARDFLTEIHRVVGFLFSSSRMYGSAEHLVQLLARPELSRGLDTDDGPAIHFLKAWAKALEILGDEKIPIEQDPFRTIMADTDTLPGEGDVSLETIYAMTIPLDGDSPETPMSLYDVLDNLIWAHDLDGARPTNCYIRTNSHILPLVVRRTGSSVRGLGMEVPVTWYADRYMEEHAASTKRMRQDTAVLRRRLARTQAKIDSLETHQLPNRTEPVDMMKLLPTVIEGCKIRSANAEDQHDQKRGSKIAEQLQTVLGNVQQRLAALKQSRERISQLLEEASSLLKSPEASPSDVPKLSYHLCGVATDSHTTYVLNQGEGADGYHWIKTEYSTTPSISQTLVSEFDVLQVASEESDKVLLVYASEQSCQYSEFPELPTTLKAFIEQDNADFLAECDQQTAHNAAENNTNGSDQMSWATGPPSIAQQNTQIIGGNNGVHDPWQQMQTSKAWSQYNTAGPGAGGDWDDGPSSDTAELGSLRSSRSSSIVNSVEELSGIPGTGGVGGVTARGRAGVGGGDGSAAGELRVTNIRSDDVDQEGG